MKTTGQKVLAHPPGITNERFLFSIMAFIKDLFHFGI